MRASRGFLPGRALSTRGRCRSHLRPAVVATAFSAPRTAFVVVTRDRRRRQERLIVSTPTSSPSLPSSPKARGGPTRLTPSTAAAAAATTGGEPSSSSSNAESPPSLALVLYSKQNCPLCQGLEEKVRAALSRGAFMPGSKLKDVTLEIRDIETKKEWEAAFAMEVPVLFWKEETGGESKETPIPRSPPRVTAEKLSTTLEAAMP